MCWLYKLTFKFSEQLCTLSAAIFSSRKFGDISKDKQMRFPDYFPLYKFAFIYLHLSTATVYRALLWKHWCQSIPNKKFMWKNQPIYGIHWVFKLRRDFGLLFLHALKLFSQPRGPSGRWHSPWVTTAGQNLPWPSAQEHMSGHEQRSHSTRMACM